MISSHVFETIFVPDVFEKTEDTENVLHITENDLMEIKKCLQSERERKRFTNSHPLHMGRRNACNGVSLSQGHVRKEAWIRSHPVEKITIKKSFCYFVNHYRDYSIKRVSYLHVEYMSNDVKCHTNIDLDKFGRYIQPILQREWGNIKYTLHQELLRKTHQARFQELHEELLMSYWHLDNIHFWKSQIESQQFHKQ